MAVLLKDAEAEPDPDARGRPGDRTPVPSRTSLTGTTRSSPTCSRFAPPNSWITEGGFGSDMGFEKHVNLVCRRAGFHPSAVVLVATLRALRHHGDGDLATGAANLERHVEIVRGFGIDPVVAVNRFPEDSDADVELVRALALEHGAFAAEATSGYSEGGMARLLSLRRSPRPASGPQGCISRTTCRIRSSRRSRSWRARSTARPASSSAPTPSRRSSPASGKGSSACRSAWRRHRCRCPTTRHS